EKLPGHVPVKGFKLERLGSRIRGNIVFEIPAEGVKDLELRFYDFAHGHIFHRLKKGEVPEKKPVLDLAKNEVLEAGVYAFRKTKEFGGRTAPGGMTFVEVELMARSMWVWDVDATAFDPKAKKGDRLNVGTVADWIETDRYLTMVADGEYGYAVEPETAMPKSPRFLPDVATGERAVFLVPEKCTSLELRCDFPNARTPDGEVIHPKGLVFALEGKRPEVPPRKGFVEIDDEIFQVAVTKQEVAEARLILDITVKNSGGKGEFFQTTKQLQYIAESGARSPVHEASFSLLHRPAELVWIPKGEQRTFQVIFEIPKTDRKPRLAYNGVSKAHDPAALRPIGGAPEEKKEEEKPFFCPECGTKAKKGDRFCGGCGSKLED
ncbi:MAG: zinc ribbon domain-containing protein, partial [Planctomycetota bacterium]